jgi:hypothetical protein
MTEIMIVAIGEIAAQTASEIDPVRNSANAQSHHGHPNFS